MPRLAPVISAVLAVIALLASFEASIYGRSSALIARRSSMARYPSAAWSSGSVRSTEGDSRPNLVAERFDAGIHLGEFVERDMVAVKVSRPQRAAIVAAPAYFKSHPKPKTPRDLTAHPCLGHRMSAHGSVYRWEFEKRGKPVTVSTSGPLIFTDPEFTLKAALDGLGAAYLFEDHVPDQLARGELVRVLEDRCPPFDGYFLYYASRRHQPPALQALVDALRV
jgi:DNA-binding transcriptional LysR family regulator